MSGHLLTQVIGCFGRLPPHSFLRPVRSGKEGKCQVLLLFGDSAESGQTRIMCTLRELYGPGVEKLRIDQRVFVTPSNRKLDVNVVQSNYHIELTPSFVSRLFELFPFVLTR